MVQNETNMVVADNSGAKSVRIFRLYGGSKRKSSSIGDICLCSVKSAIPNAKVKKGDIVKCVIVRTKKGINRSSLFIKKPPKVYYALWEIFVRINVFLIHQQVNQQHYYNHLLFH